MNHLTEEQLNEYLDSAVFDNSITRHLETCNDCSARLEELQRVFTALESLPEIQHPRDLTASILAQLPPRLSEIVSRSTPTLKWLAFAQTAAALAIFAWLASSLTPLFAPNILPPEITNFQLPTLDSLLASIVLFLSSISIEAPDSSVIFQPSPFDLQSTTLLLFIASAAVLWLVGNGLLLRSPARDRQQ